MAGELGRLLPAGAAEGRACVTACLLLHCKQGVQASCSNILLLMPGLHRGVPTAHLPAVAAAACGRRQEAAAVEAALLHLFPARPQAVVGEGAAARCLIGQG